MNFASDNAGPVHPEVMAALNRANDGHEEHQTRQFKGHEIVSEKRRSHWPHYVVQRRRRFDTRQPVTLRHEEIGQQGYADQTGP